MNKATFFVAIDSYIIRKGIISILKNLSAAELMLDTDNPDVLKNRLKDSIPDFIIISRGLLQKCSLLMEDQVELSEKIILLLQDGEKMPGGKVYKTILLSESKHDIVVHLQKLINPFLDRKITGRASVLSEREITILKYVATGLTNQQIANKLFLSLHTVTTHRKNISSKLSIKSVSGLTVYAIVNNIISIEDIEKTTR